MLVHFIKLWQCCDFLNNSLQNLLIVKKKALKKVNKIWGRCERIDRESIMIKDITTKIVILFI